MKLDTCGCCEANARPTPAMIDNRPGMSAVSYRVGTFASFRQAMLQEIAATPELAPLRTRLRDDYAITVLEMWAIVADILTFYQERIANEGFLRTARLRDSVLRLARLLDYKLGHGAAAKTLLAFTLEKDAQLEIPVGLRVQSVPQPEGQPQKFETLESIQADARLNRLRILPAPVGINPLAKGRTQAILATGRHGLAAAEGLAPGDRFLLFKDGENIKPEVKTVEEMRVEEDHIILAWTEPIQGDSWDMTTSAFKLKRTFRIFGHNAPLQFMKPFADNKVAGGIRWELQETKHAFSTVPVAEFVLDALYEDIAAGSRLLVSIDKGQKSVVTVTSVHPAQPTVGPLSDTVTKLTVNPTVQLAAAPNVEIYELEGRPICFWGYEYPGTLTSPTVYLPGQRVDEQTIEVGRTIKGNKYQPGVRIQTSEIDIGRKVIVLDDQQRPGTAFITGASIVGTEVSFGPTPDDSTTVNELGLDPDQAQLVTGIISGSVQPGLTLTNPTPQVSVTIGSVGPRTIDVSQSIQDALNAADRAPEFSQARLLYRGGRLIIFAGRVHAKVVVGPTPADSTTVKELALEPEQARPITGLMSGTLKPFPTVSNSTPQLSVSMGPLGPLTLRFSQPLSLGHAFNLLQAAINGIDGAPVFAQALLHPFTLEDRLLVMPGNLGAEPQEYLKLDVQPDAKLNLDSRSAVLLGNNALASHGETIEAEVIGDGDAAAKFQRFDLKKSPVTFVPSAGPSGIESSLRVLVNRVLWREVPTLFGQAAKDQVYTTRMADDGTMTVQFGDGTTGARPPSGRQNVVARYRQGLGLAGRVPGETLTTLLDRPVGLKSVTNPAAADGGADPETLDDARQNAPSTVRTFGRAVSLRDFEDLVRTSGEVAKARATWVWNGLERAVHLTIAGQQGGIFSSDALVRIHASLNTQRDPNYRLFLDNFVQVPVVITATIHVAATHAAADVAADARTALLEALSFEVLQFGQPLPLSDVYRVLQKVGGVEWVDIDRFHFKDQAAAWLASRGADSSPLQQHLRVYPARPKPNPPPLVLPAEQAFIEIPSQDISIVTAGGLPS